MPTFVATTYNPTLQDMHFNEFMIPSVKDLMDGNEDMLLCPTTVIKSYLPRTE